MKIRPDEFNWAIRKLTEAGLAEVRDHISGYVLDVGCGTKPYEQMFTNDVRAYIGVEYPTEHWSWELHAESNVDCWADGQKLPFTDASFDSLVSFQTLEHIRNPQECINEMTRVLKPGGTILLTAPFFHMLHNEPHDYFRFTRHWYEWVLKEQGFQILKIRPMGTFWVSIIMLCCYHLYYKRGFFKRRFFYPFYWVMNHLALLLDLLDKNARMPHDYLVLARKN